MGSLRPGGFNREFAGVVEAVTAALEIQAAGGFIERGERARAGAAVFASPDGPPAGL